MPKTPTPADDIDALVAEAREMRRLWAASDLRFLLGIWREHKSNLGGAETYIERRQKITDLLRDLEG